MKPDPPLPDELCSECGRVINRRSRANIIAGDRVVCSACKRKFNKIEEKAARVATQRQLAFLQDLGFRGFENCSFDRAHYTLDHAQEIRDYIIEVARQEWGKSLYGYDLRPLVLKIFAHETMREEIFTEMTRNNEIAFDRLNQSQAEHFGERNYEPPSYRDVVPRLANNANYARVRTELTALLGDVVAIQRGSLWKSLTDLFRI